MIASHFSKGFSRGLMASALLLSLLTTGLSGQVQDKDNAKAAQRQAHENAKALAAGGDLAAAAQVLDALSSAPVNSATRHFETAQRLTLLASTLSRSGNAAGARAAAAGALQYLAAAERRPSDPELKAAIKSQIGFLQERYLGDLESAKTAYRAAAQLAPGNAAARAKADQIEAADANARRKADHTR